MALFSKPPAKKPEPSKPEPRLRSAPPGTRPVSARDVVSQIAGRAVAASAAVPPSDTSATHSVPPPAAKAAIEIDTAGQALCGPLENAALLFASDQARAARQLLEDGVTHDPEAKVSTLAWLSLFDLLRRAGDRGAFDRLALQYVVAFERSAPSWEELGGPGPAERGTAGGGAIALSGALTAASAAQIDPLNRLPAEPGTQAKLDLANVIDFDDPGARLLADALAGVRRRRVPLAIEHPDKVANALQSAVNQGREVGEGPWLLLLELLQWQGEQPTFDDRAVEYAVTFEMSPPSWEPPALPGPAIAPAPKRNTRARSDAEVLAWSDEIKGPSPAAVTELLDFAQARSNVLLDLTQVERIDFVSGGALANALHRLTASHKSVQIVGASPIIRALLLLVGVPGEIFIRKAA